MPRDERALGHYRGDSLILALTVAYPDQMESRLTLESATREFFRLYWNPAAISEECPQWRTWHLTGLPPEAEMGGCYAIYRGETLLYIGVAVTEGKHSSAGKKYGLLNRLVRHVIRRKERASLEFVPYDHKGQWKNISSIRLIGFPDRHRHLAAALEAYLITRLDCVVNAQSRWRAEHKHLKNI